MLHKQIYEIDRVLVQEKFEQVQSFISLSRNFSVKVHGHLKILVHLVNNLVESEDNVELVDTLLKMPNFKSEIQTVNKTLIRTEKNVTDEKEQQNLDKFYDIIRNENQKIQEQIQKGEQNTEFLKSIFNKMFDALQTQAPSSSELKHKIINQYSHNYENPHSINVNLQHPKNPIQSLYFPLEQKEPLQRRSVRSLKHELDEVRNQVQQIKDKKPDSEDANRTIKKLMDQKADQEDKLFEQEKLIKKLRKELEMSKENVGSLQKQLMQLIESNRTLERVVRDLLIQVKDKPDVKEMVFDLEKMNKQLEDKVKEGKNQNRDKDREIEHLNNLLKQKSKALNQNMDLNNEKDLFEKENKKLHQKLKDLENENENYQKELNELNRNAKRGTSNRGADEPKYNHSDFLKCLYGQAHYIESQRPMVGVSRKSYQSYA